MATPLQAVYDAFLAKIEADDWMLENLTSEDVMEDWRMLLNAAIFQFRYPRISLENDGTSFEEDLTNDEIQMLSNLMKLEWERRCLAVWDNIRQLYNSRDYSQANFLDKINKTVAQTQDECRLMMDRYGRAANYKPNKIFGQLAGK